MNMNQVVLMGHAGADAKIFDNENPGRSMLAFNMATNHYYTDKNGEKIVKTDWHQIRAYGKITSSLKNRVLKGRALFVEGELKNGTPSEKNGTRYQNSFIKAHRVLVLAPAESQEPHIGDIDTEEVLELDSTTQSEV